MSELLNSTNRLNLVAQFVLILIGVLGSVSIVIMGLLQEDILKVVTAPFEGLFNQILMVLMVQLHPFLILLFGSIGFIALYLVPGVIVTYALFENADGFSRVLFGTAVSLLAMFFPMFYGLLLGAPPHWALGFLPLVLAIATVLFRPSILNQFRQDALNAKDWVISDSRKIDNVWFWLVILVFILFRVGLFSLTDGYWTDSVTYVSYAEGIASGALLTGQEFTNPIGFPLISFPFTWIVGEITWGLALANWCLTLVTLVGAIPLLKRIHHAWPTERKPPFRLVYLAFISFPWSTILMTTLFHEASLFYFTILGTSAIGARVRFSEIWLGVSVGIAYLIRPSHAIMYFAFMLVPLYENRDSLMRFFSTGFRSFVVALPVIPLLVRNFLIEGSFLASYDLQFFGFNNLPQVLMWLASFVTHSSVGLFTLLFVLQLFLFGLLFLKKLPKLNTELYAWLLFSLVSFVVLALYPSDQPRLFSFFLWLLPIFLVYELWDRDWTVTALLFIGWQFVILGMIPFSSQGWIIAGASSVLPSTVGLLRPMPGADSFLIYGGLFFLFVLWLLIVVSYTESDKDEFPQMVDSQNDS
ncbi:MAG: hypothetical protein ACXAEN_15170 [Candidatus Thorarchaeota archaeon]|jgi:hypothetical protein